MNTKQFMYQKIHITNATHLKQKSSEYSHPLQKYISYDEIS